MLLSVVMKKILTYLATITALSQLTHAGGNSSIVEMDKVESIKIEKQKITVTGSAVVRRRVMSIPEKGDHRALGQPAQWFYAKVEKATFVIVPYNTPGITGVPGAGKLDEEGKRRVAKWWADTKAGAKKVKKGDTIQIGYQGDITTINGLLITKIEGFGSISIKKTPTK